MSPLGVVPKDTEGQFMLIINMRYVNENMVKKKFKLEGLEDLVDLEGGPRILLRSYTKLHIMLSVRYFLERTLRLKYLR